MRFTVDFLAYATLRVLCFVRPRFTSRVCALRTTVVVACCVCVLVGMCVCVWTCARSPDLCFCALVCVCCAPCLFVFVCSPVSVHRNRVRANFSLALLSHLCTVCVWVCVSVYDVCVCGLEARFACSNKINSSYDVWSESIRCVKRVHTMENYKNNHVCTATTTCLHNLCSLIIYHTAKRQ